MKKELINEVLNRAIQSGVIQSTDICVLKRHLDDGGKIDDFVFYDYDIAVDEARAILEKSHLSSTNQSIDPVLRRLASDKQSEIFFAGYTAKNSAGLIQHIPTYEICRENNSFTYYFFEEKYVIL